MTFMEILLRGSEAWNNWRAEFLDVNPILFAQDLSGLNLANYNLSDTILSDANLNDTDLSKASLSGADLSDASLERSILRYTNLGYANLLRANLKKTDISFSVLEETFFTNVDLTEVIGLDRCIHAGPSNVDYRTTGQSVGVPTEFLKGCGLSDWQIEQTKLNYPNLTNKEIKNVIERIYDLRAHQAVQISPLFISYSHADTAFVDKLEEGLTKKGIRFWRDIKHGTAGKLERQVDRAMKLNDTVLLVLSEHSVNSDWVELEAAKARKLEKETKKDVLCPIALDDSWKDCNWTESMRYQIKKYNVLDFSGWDDEGVFTRQFARLLDGLEIFYE